MFVLLWFLEFKSKYDMFKTGVLKSYLSKEFSKTEVEDYMRHYLEWKMLENEVLTNKSKVKDAEVKKEFISN